MELSAYTVEESAEAIAVNIVLHIAIIRMIENVEDSQSDPRMLFLNGQSDFAPDLQIGRNEARQLQFISRANKVAILIDG